MGKDTVFCMNCGQELPAEAKFCFACGQRVETGSGQDAAGGIWENVPCQQRDTDGPAKNDVKLTLTEFREQAPSQTGFREQLLAYRKSLPHSWDYNAYVGILLGAAERSAARLTAQKNYAVGQGDNGKNATCTIEMKGLTAVYEKYRGKNISPSILLSDVEDEIVSAAPGFAEIRKKFHEIVFAEANGNDRAAESISAPQAPAAPEKSRETNPFDQLWDDFETDPSLFDVEDCNGGYRICNYLGLNLGSTKLGSVVIPSHIGEKKVVEIGKEAFAERCGLLSVTIPDGVTEIGENVFYGCLRLTSVTIPNSVTKIGPKAFHFCGKLTSVTIPSGVTKIAESTFACCESLTSIIIPDSVTEIGYGAFSNCHSLTNLTIPDSVTKIGEAAFFFCNRLASLTIPDSVTEVGARAFNDCDKLTVRAPAGSSAAWRAMQSQVVKVEYIASRILPNHFEVEACTGGCRIKKYVGPKQDDLVIPSHIGGKKVVEIDKDAFAKSWALTGLTIPDSVTEIAESAFFDCWSLVSVTIPSSVTKIGRRAFYNCNRLASLTIPDSVTEIGEAAFEICKSLTSVTIPNSVTEIGKAAFDGCKSLTSVTIPKGVTKIGEGVFRVCESLTSVTIPNGVTEIGNSAFMGCASLVSVTIPKSVTRIGGLAFRSCKSLTSLTIPNGVTEIGVDMFFGCASLTSLTIPKSVTKIYPSAFGIGICNDRLNFCRNLTIYAPVGSVAELCAKKYGIPFQPL